MSEKDDAGVEKKDDQQSSEADTEVEEQDGASASEQDEPDWKAIAEKERDRAENYKKAFTQKRQFVKAAEKEVDENDEEDELSSKVRRIIREEVTPALSENKVDVQLKELVKDPAKREAVKLIYENRIRQTGTNDEAIATDLSAALDIADGHKLRKVNAELHRKNNMQHTAPTSGSSADRGVDKKNHQFSDTQIKSLTETARRLGADPTKFIEQAWKNQNKG